MCYWLIMVEENVTISKIWDFRLILSTDGRTLVSRQKIIHFGENVSLGVIFEVI